MLTINLSLLVGLISKQERLKRLATDGCARYIHIAGYDGDINNRYNF